MTTNQRRSLATVCVFMGSSAGRRPAYTEAAQALGSALAAAEITLMYGGGKVGLMGATADAGLDAGGRVHGVITQSLQRREVGHDGLHDLQVVETMHQRKAAMADSADGFIALPGGFGTLDEFFEIVTWLQLGLHDKPCGLLNVAGYFDGLLSFLDHSVNERFVHADHRNTLIVEDNPEALLDRMQRQHTTLTEKWLD